MSLETAVRKPRLTFRPEVNLPEGFRTLVESRPAFDDLHGDYGVSSVELFFHLIGPLGAITWELSTGWYLPETALRGPAYSDSVRFHNWSRERELEKPSGQVVSWHRWAKSGRDCNLSPTGKCWGDVGFLMAEIGTPILLVNGVEGIWNWLLETYQETEWKRRDAWIK